MTNYSGAPCLLQKECFASAVSVDVVFHQFLTHFGAVDVP